MFVFLFYLVFPLFHSFLISFPHFFVYPRIIPCFSVGYLFPFFNNIWLFFSDFFSVFYLPSSNFSTFPFSLFVFITFLSWSSTSSSSAAVSLDSVIDLHRSIVCAAEISMRDVACLRKKATVVKKFLNGIKMFFNYSWSMNGPLLTPGGASSPMGKIAFLQ